MLAVFDPHRPGGFAVIALITFLVVLVVLPVIDKIASAESVPLE